MSFPFPKSLFLELARYPLFLEFLQTHEFLSDMPSISGFQNLKTREQRNVILSYFQNKINVVNEAIEKFLQYYPAFYGVVFAINQMAIEFSISRVEDTSSTQERSKLVLTKIQFIKECLVRAKMPKYSSTELKDYITQYLVHPYLLSFDFKNKLLSKIQDKQEDTVNLLYNYATGIANKFVEMKEPVIDSLNKIMESTSTVKDFFDRVVVINLDRRRDRWDALQKKFAAINWPFKDPERFSAYDGSKLPVPVGWTSGPGTWGCMLSHREVLSRAIQDGLDNILILEDDIFFADNFEDRAIEFIKAVPPDWHQIMLGGQYFENSKAYDISPLVRKVSLCHRTHAIALRGAFMHYTYSKLCASYGHVDHIMNTFQERYNVYTPRHFLIGQDGSASDVSGATGGADLMRNPPDSSTPIFLIKADPELLNIIISSNLPLNFGTINEAGMNANLDSLYHSAARTNRQTLLSNLNSFLISNIWYARSVYPSKYFTILNPKDVLVDELKIAANGLNLVYVESLDQIYETISKYPFEEELPTQFP